MITDTVAKHFGDDLPLIRAYLIHESVVQWTKDFGSEGYFKFISEFIDTEIRASKKYFVEDRFLNM